MSPADLPLRRACLLLAFVVAAWGANWSVSKALLDYVSPLWATALRALLACAGLWLLCLARAGVRPPARADLPLVCSVGVLHMTAFSLLCSLGLQALPAGRSIVLAYTTPLWVLPAARLFLGEPLHAARVLGLLLGLAGLALMLRPGAFDWHDSRVLAGHACILGAALCWAACIVYGRAHPGRTAAFALLPWQLLLAATLLGALALAVEGLPRLPSAPRFWGLLAYASLVGTVLAYWAMNTVNRGMPASFTSMALLAVPVAGLLFATLALREPLDLWLAAASALVVAGVACSARRPAGAGRG
ncbi:DMT family transporter [Orrella sp. JC864]|uniref:DMT family transporter n=1 Tax=Orrella sp. JC864 TaxID=3120298 RepID=UPI00300A0765